LYYNKRLRSVSVNRCMFEDARSLFLIGVELWYRVCIGELVGELEGDVDAVEVE